MSSHVSPGWTSVEYVRWPRPFPRSMSLLLDLRCRRPSRDVLGIPRGGRADNRFGHRDAMNHLFKRDRKLRASVGGSCKGLERGASDVERLRLPGLGRSLDRLELTAPEEPRPPLLGGSPGDVRHPLDAYPTTGSEDLEAEPRARCRHRPQVARHSLLHAEQDRRGVVRLDLDGTAEALAIDPV